MTQPTTRLTRRATRWTRETTTLAAQRARGAARHARRAGRRVAQSLTAARDSGIAQITQAGRELRASLLAEESRARHSEHPFVIRDVLFLFLASVVTGTVYGLSASWSQTLTTAVCALTLSLFITSRAAQRSEAAALKRSLDELRESLRVTHALLEASELTGAEELRASLMPAAPAPAADDDETRRIGAASVTSARAR